MKTLTKKYRVVYRDGEVLSDYRTGQSGTTYIGIGAEGFESDILDDVIAFVEENNLQERELDYENI
ncbi:MAG: hypothetical protein ACK5LF_14590 [Bacteroides xylanisolvens]